MKHEDYHQGPFVNGGNKPSGGPFIGGRLQRPAKQSTANPQPSGRAPQDRPGGPKRGRGAWRHLLLALAVAGGIAIVRVGIENSDGINIETPDFSNIPTISSETDATAPTVRVPSLSDTKDTSEDLNVESSSQIVTVEAVTGNTVRVRNILGRKLTWQIKCPVVRRAVVAQTGEKPILGWERNTQGKVVVTRVLVDGKLVQCPA